jgi:hypothetical protein
VASFVTLALKLLWSCKKEATTLPSTFVDRVRSDLDRGFFIDLPKFPGPQEKVLKGEPLVQRRVKILAFEHETDGETEQLSIEFQLDPAISLPPPTPEPVFLFTFTSDLSVEENFSELKELVLANPTGVGDPPAYDVAYGD